MSDETIFIYSAEGGIHTSEPLEVTKQVPLNVVYEVKDCSSVWVDVLRHEETKPTRFTLFPTASQQSKIMLNPKDTLTIGASVNKKGLLRVYLTI